LLPGREECLELAGASSRPHGEPVGALDTGQDGMFQFDFDTFRLLILGTDLLLFSLVFVAAAFFWGVRKREDYRAAWRQIRSRTLPMICLGVCLIYAAAALLDSVHFQKRARTAGGAGQDTGQGDPIYETGVLTALDLLCQGLRDKTEKTFSSPFATHQFVKEIVELPDGTTVRDYPRLTYGGQGLRDPGAKWRQIGLLALRGAFSGAGTGILLICLCVGLFVWKARRWAGSGNTGGAARTGLRVGAFLAAVAVLVSVIASLSTQYHVLGTDQVGQDILYRAIKGARVGLVLGILTTLIATPLAILLGIAAGYLGGRIDDLIQYVYTTVDSIPSILLIAAVMLIVTALATSEQTVRASDTRLLWLCVVLGVGSWTGLCRLLRGETLKVKETEYVQAAEAFGLSRPKIMFRHILPNVMHIVLISVVLRFSGLVLAEAVLAYVGIGVDPSMESWGNMINAARLDISRDPAVWWNLLAAFLFMFGLVLPANIFGDAVRDALDPRLKTR
jgi:peptide/nickel transport system permease protein